MDPCHTWHVRQPDEPLSQLWSFKIRRATLHNYIKFVDPRILRLENREKARREWFHQGTNKGRRSYLRETLKLGESQVGLLK